MQKEDRWVSTKEGCEYLGVTRQSIIKRLEINDLPL